jgi:translation initiation factor IF-2
MGCWSRCSSENYAGRAEVLNVFNGMECGVGISNFTDIKVGDTVEAFVTEKMAAELTAS